MRVWNPREVKALLPLYYDHDPEVNILKVEYNIEFRGCHASDSVSTNFDT